MIVDQCKCFLFLLTILLLSCKEETIEIPFTQIQSNTNFTLNDIHFVHPDTGYIVGGATWFNGIALSSFDAGATWQLDSLGDKELFNLHFDQNNKAHAVGISGHLFEKEFDDSNWELISKDYDVMYRGVAHNNGRTIITSGVAFQFGSVLTFDENYDLINVDSFEQEMSAVYFSDENRVHATGYGVVLLSTDAGLTWKRQSITGDFFRKIHFPSTQVGYAIGSVGGTIIKTMDGGESWDKIRDGTKISKKDIPFRSLYFVDERKGYLVGEQGVFWRTTDGGNNWNVVSNFPNVDLLDIHIINGKGYIVGTEGSIFTFDD